MFIKSCLALLVTLSSCFAGADELTFKAILNSDFVGLQLSDAAERAQYLDWAKAFNRYRRLPLSPEKIDSVLNQGIDGDLNHKESEELVLRCAHDPASNVFCPVIMLKTKSVELVTPKSLRDKYYDALLKLDNVKLRPLTCKPSTEALKSVIADEHSVRLRARALYWLWMCAGILKNDKARGEYKEQLWRHYPFDHHTYIVLTTEKDARISERLHDDTDLPVAVRSELKPETNAMLKGIEALLLQGQGGNAAYVAEAIDQDLRQLEPEVRLYVAGLMARISRRIPSALPVSRLLVPLIAARPEYLNAATVTALFPNDYALFDSEQGKVVPANELIDKYRDHIKPNLLAGLIYYESAYNPKAASGANAFGLIQMLLSTASEEYQIESGDRTAQVTRDQLTDPRFALKLGVGYLERIKGTGSWSLALAAYNQGPTAVRRGLDAEAKIRDPQLQMDLLLMKERLEIHASDYVSSVLGKANWYSAIYGN